MSTIAFSQLNFFDLVLLALSLTLGIKGFVTGFAKEFWALMGLIVGVFLGSQSAGEMAAFIDKNFMHLQNTTILELLGFFAVLMAVWVASTLLGAISAKLLDSNPGFFSRLFGFLFATAKYFVVFALIIGALSSVKLAKQKLGKYVDHSQLYPHLIAVSSTLMPAKKIQK